MSAPKRRTSKFDLVVCGGLAGVCAAMGQAVGTCAWLCKKQRCSPR